MLVRYRPTPEVEFEVDGATHKDLFAALAQICEVFGEPDCGQCGSRNLYYNIRNPVAKQGRHAGKKFIYYEVACRDCGCFLPIGQHNSEAGTLFPDRKLVDEKGEYVIKDGKKVFDKEHRGWRRSAFRQMEGDEDEGGGGA